MKKIIALLLSFALMFSFVPRVKAASLSAEKTEVLSERTAYGKTYRLANGTYQYVGYTEPIHYKDNSGAYVEINNAITDTVKLAGYKYTNTANQWNVHFSEKLDNSNAVMLTSGKYTISFSLVEKTGTAGVVKATALASSKDNLSAYHQKLSADNRAVLYPDVAENVDIAYAVQADALKEDIILKSPSAPSVYRFRLTTNGLTIKETDGKLSLCTAVGEEVFSLAPLFMEDASGKRSENISMTYTSVKNGYELTVSADTAFLNAKDTVYPVVIDPSVVIVSGTVSAEDTYADQQYSNSNYGLSESLLTGGASSSYAKRTYLNFYYPLNIRTFQITSVYVYMPKRNYQTPNIRAYAVTGGWSYDSLTWNNQPTHSSTICSSTSVNTTRYGSTNWYKMEITDILKGWLDLTIDEYGLVLKEVYETSSSTKTSYYASEASSPNNPELEINYNPYYGSRPYQATSRTDVNCMGYAIEYAADITNTTLNVNLNELYGEDIWEIGYYYRDKFDDWMQDYLGANNWAYLATYDSGINENWFRVFYIVNVYDTNYNGVFDQGEGIGYHWYYQTNQGYWAQKNGPNADAQYIVNSVGQNPLDLWKADSPDYEISSYGYYQIRDMRNISW